MAIIELTLDALAELDGGRVVKAFAHELKRAVSDCADRPADKGARKVLLELKVTPIIEDGFCEEVHAEFQIKSTVPTRKSKTYSFGLRKNGSVVFNSNSPEVVDQKSLLDDQE